MSTVVAGRVVLPFSEFIVNDINKWPYSQKQPTDVRQEPFFSEAKEYSARYFA